MSIGRKPLRFVVPCFVLIGLAFAIAIHQHLASVRAAQDPAPTQQRRQISPPPQPTIYTPSSPSAPAATITVNSLLDGAPANNGQCTLREAMLNANNNNQSGSTDCTAGSGADTITVNVFGTINLTGALPDISESLTINNGPVGGGLTVRRDTGGDYRIFQVNGKATVTLSGMTITNGRSDFGGGINNNGTLTISRCALTANTASVNGGGVDSLGTLTINQSTISGNTAGDGGGVFTQGPLLTMTNSTISGNTATVFAGGIKHVNFGGPATNVIVTNCTVTGNTGPTEGGIATVAQPDAAVTSLKNTIVANNSNPNISQVNAGASVVSQGNNLASDNGSGLLTAGGDLINTNPLLAPLGNYGPLYQTHLLLDGSPARNAGNNAGAPSIDQRTVFRPVGAVVDIGAVENDISLTINPASLPSSPLNQPYSQQLSVTGTTGSGTIWTISSGNAPVGLTLSFGGLLSGIPTVNGTYNFTVVVASSNGAAGVRSYTVIVGSGGSGLQFYPLPAPVRLLETRPGFTGCTTPGVPITANSTLTLPAQGACSGIPANAAAVTGNITVVPAESGFLTLFPSDAALPTVANSNFKAGEVTNNFFTVGLGANDGAFKIYSSATTQIIIDLTGYYAPPSLSGLFYHSLPTPVRLVETRSGQTGCFQPPQLQGTNNANADPALDLPVQGRGPGLPPACSSIPNDAVVLVGNATTVLPDSPAGFGYLTIYPSDATRPTVASSNYATNDVINGPFAVKLGTDGKFKIYTFSTTHLVVDISGYYSTSPTDANGTGLLFNPLPKPIRLLETRPDFPGFPLTGCYRTNTPVPGSPNVRTQQAWGLCADQPPLTIPNAAQALVGNVTVLNPVGGGFLTFFPGNVGTAPTVATSNYPFPVVFGYNRHYYVGLSPSDGTFKMLTQSTTDLIIDVAGYFAP